MKVQFAALAAILFLIASGGAAFAQENVPQAIEYRKWDIGTTVGFLAASGRHFSRAAGSYDNSNPSWSFNLDAGRFITNHVKIDTGVMWSGTHSFYQTTFSATPPNRSTGYTLRSIHPTTFSGAVTYQFLENAFTHPYVSGGVRLTLLREDLETYSYSTNCCPSGLLDSANRTSLQARPFGAFGLKSYLSERWFVRSEIVVGFDTKGVSHGTGRVGVGIDF
jgi:hypothetical protein